DASTQRILDAKAKAWEIHGYSREEFLALRTEDVADSGGKPNVQEVIRILRETGRYEGDRHIHRRKDGSKFPCAINLRQVSVGGGSSIRCGREMSPTPAASQTLKKSSGSSVNEGATKGTATSTAAKTARIFPAPST